MSKQNSTSGAAPKPRKRFQDMTSAELREATRKYDAEIVDPLATARPFEAKDKRRHARTRRRDPAQIARGEPVGNATAAQQARAAAIANEVNRGGRPLVGRGAERVMVSIERGLLAEIDAFADKAGKSRSELIAEGLRKVIKGGRRKSA